MLREARKKSGKIACSTPYTRKALFFAFLPRKIVRFIFLGVRNDEVRKDRVEVKLALEDMGKPIGVADYQLIVPKEKLQKVLTDEIKGV